MKGRCFCSLNRHFGTSAGVHVCLRVRRRGAFVHQYPRHVASVPSSSRDERSLASRHRVCCTVPPGAPVWRPEQAWEHSGRSHESNDRPMPPRRARRFHRSMDVRALSHGGIARGVRPVGVIWVHSAIMLSVPGFPYRIPYHAEKQPTPPPPPNVERNTTPCQDAALKQAQNRETTIPHLLTFPPSDNAALYYSHTLPPRPHHITPRRRSSNMHKRPDDPRTETDTAETHRKANIRVCHPPLTATPQPYERALPPPPLP